MRWTRRKLDTVVVVRDVDALPTYVADRLAAVLLTGPGATMPVVVTAENLAALPAAFTTAITAAVPVRARKRRRVWERGGSVIVRGLVGEASAG